MINILELNYKIFHILYDITNYFPEFNTLVYILAERIDMYVVAFGIFFVIIHRHETRLNRPILLSRISVKEGIYTSIGIAIAWAISYIIKISFAISRPFLEFSEVIPLFLYGGNDSFPSGHATLFAALAVAIYLHHRKVGAIFIFAAFVIAIARVIAGVHFPIDILVGWFIGGSVSYFTYLFMEKRDYGLVHSHTKQASPHRSKK